MHKTIDSPLQKAINSYFYKLIFLLLTIFAQNVYAQEFVNISSRPVKELIVAENDHDDKRSNQLNPSYSEQNENDKFRRDNDDYAPQCDTPVWAMCTKRKKYHKDD